MRNLEFQCIGRSRCPILPLWAQALKKSLPSSPDSFGSCLIHLNTEGGRRLRTRCTISRYRQSSSSSPPRRNYVKPHSPLFGRVPSPPLCNSPTRNRISYCTRSRNTCHFGLTDCNIHKTTNPTAYFISKPPSEPVRLIFEPPLENCPGFKLNTLNNVSQVTPCNSKKSPASSTILTETSSYISSRTSKKLVRRLLRSLILKLPLNNTQETSIHLDETLSDNKSSFSQEMSQRNVAVQVFASSTINRNKEVEENVVRKRARVTRISPSYGNATVTTAAADRASQSLAETRMLGS